MSYNPFPTQTQEADAPPGYAEVSFNNSEVTFRYTAADTTYAPLPSTQHHQNLYQQQRLQEQQHPPPQQPYHQPVHHAQAGGQHYHQPPVHHHHQPAAQPQAPRALDLDDFLVQPDPPAQTYNDYNLNTNASHINPYTFLQNDPFSETVKSPLIPPTTRPNQNPSLNGSSSSRNLAESNGRNSYQPPAIPGQAAPLPALFSAPSDSTGGYGGHYGAAPDPKPASPHNANPSPNTTQTNQTTTPTRSLPQPTGKSSAVNMLGPVILDENHPDYDPFLAMDAVQTLSLQPTPQTAIGHLTKGVASTPTKAPKPAPAPKPPKPVAPTVDVTKLIHSGQIMLPFDDFECEICGDMTIMEFFNQEFQFLGCFPGELDEFRNSCPALTLSTCLHSFCFECLTAYVTNYIESDLVQAQIKRIPCMEMDCGAWITQTELRVILPAAEYTRFEQQQLEWSTLANANMYKCITPNCPAIIEKTGDLIGDERTGRFNPRLVCPQCNITQCVKCNVKWHANLTCKEFEAKTTEEEAIKNSALLSKAADFDARSPQFRKCPQCQIMIEKVTGCDKVKCLCGYGMCWICGSPGARCQCTKGNHVFFDNVTGHGTRDISNK